MGRRNWRHFNLGRRLGEYRERAGTDYESASKAGRHGGAAPTGMLFDQIQQVAKHLGNGRPPCRPVTAQVQYL